jgi:hypothetical protein
MAIDPRIALGVNPPVIAPLQLRSPIEQLGKMLSLRNLMQQGEENQLGLQAKRLGIQDAERQTREDMNLRELMVRNPNPTPAQYISTVGATRALPLIKAQNEQLQQGYKTEGERFSLLGRLAGVPTDLPSAIDTVQQAVALRAFSTDPTQNAEIGTQLLNHLNTDGFDPKVFKAFQASAMDAAQAHAAQLAEAEDKRKAEESRARRPGLLADSEAKQKELDAGNLAAAMSQGLPVYQAALANLPEDRRKLFPAEPKTWRDVLKIGQTPQQAITTEQAADTAAETKAQHLITNEIDRARLGLSRQEQALRQRTFDATYGALVDPATGKAMEPEAAKAVAMQDPIAVAIANYQAAPPTLSRGGPSAGIMRKVMAINPDYNAQNWQAQGTLLKTFTSGKVASELRATNTALSHVGLLNDAIDALNNGDVRVLNQIGNRLGLETGKTPAAVFQTIVGKVGPELAQAYGEATGGERKGEQANFDPSLPPQTLRANAAITAKLLAGKIGSTKFQWESTMGKRTLPMISPEAQGVLDKLGAGTGAAAGGLPEIASQAAYDALPKGAQYTHNGEVLTKK